MDLHSSLESVIVECKMISVAPNSRFLAVVIRLHPRLKLLLFDVYLFYCESSLLIRIKCWSVLVLLKIALCVMIVL